MKYKHLITKIQSLLEADLNIQTATFTVPALIRLCEIAREDIKGDTDLHELIEAILNKSGNKTITSSMLEGISGDGDNDEDDK